MRLSRPLASERSPCAGVERPAREERVSVVSSIAVGQKQTLDIVMIERSMLKIRVASPSHHVAGVVRVQAN